MPMPSGPVPLVVVSDLSTLRAVRVEVRTAGWTLVDGLDNPVAQGRSSGRVVTGTVTDATSSASALFAAMRGNGLVVRLAAVSAVTERFVDDLLRLGDVDVRPAGAVPVLDDESLRLLRLLAGGATVAEAARALHLSLRTAHRRLGSIRVTLGLARTAQIVTYAHRTGLLGDQRATPKHDTCP